MALAVPSDSVAPRIPVVDRPRDAPALRLLICEDDPFTLKILLKRAINAGYEVQTALNGAEGLELARSFQPHLVLSDWMMPQLDGVELCERLRELPGGESIYFILLTAKDKNEDKVKALDTGADEYLVKPCEGRELMARLRAAERLIRTQQELARSNLELFKANKRINDELQQISRIQLSLLPQSLPEIQGYDFAAHYQPSTECSGDFYHLIPLAENRLGMVIGDVSGHGGPAMVAMALANTFIHQRAAEDLSPAELLSQVNKDMFAHLPTVQYCTLFYGVLDLATGDLTYSSAGHPPPMLLDGASRRMSFLQGCEGAPVKLISPEAEYENRNLHLASGQCLVLYTDGLVEAFDPEGRMYEQGGLERAIQSVDGQAAKPFIGAILSDLEAFRHEHPLEDDLSLLIVSRL